MRSGVSYSRCGDLSKANDEQLRRRIADIVDHKLVNYRISPQERSRIVRLVFSSIRGMGILDEILADDSITEIMINGPSTFLWSVQEDWKL